MTPRTTKPKDMFVAWELRGRGGEGSTGTTVESFQKAAIFQQLPISEEFNQDMPGFGGLVKASDFPLKPWFKK